MSCLLTLSSMWRVVKTQLLWPKSLLFVIFPLFFLPLTILSMKVTLAVLLALAPIANHDIAVCILSPTLAMCDSIAELTFVEIFFVVLRLLFIDILALSFHLVIDPLAVIIIAVWFLHEAPAVPAVVKPLAFVVSLEFVTFFLRPVVPASSPALG